MTLRLSYKNIAILGLLQVGVVVAAVLGAGSLHRLSRELGYPLTQATKFAGDYGFLVLAVPMVWVVVAMVLEGRESAESHEAAGLVTGLLVLVLLLIGAFQAAVLPWLRVLNPCCGLSLSA